MSEQTKPKFQDILNLIDELPSYDDFATQTQEPLTWLQAWLDHHSRTLDLSKGFLVNRCALYWVGYDAPDGFDGQAFVDSCQDSKGTLRSLAEILDTDLQIFELNPNDTSRPDSDAIALATSYGMIGVEEGTQLFCTASFGQGVTSTSQTAMENLNSLHGSHELEDFMTANCGLDHAAMLGAAVACILKGIPMILDGASGRLVKALVEKASNKTYSNLITTETLDIPSNHDLPAHDMITTAILLKTLHAGQSKTDCGKIKQAA